MKKIYLSLVLCGIAFSDAMAQVTVNATGGTLTLGYTTLGAAFTAINNGVHTGAISIELSGSTTEAGRCILNSSGAGSASFTSVEIHPTADAVTVSANTGAGFGLIELNGADNVTIDGDNPNTAGVNRNLTLTNTSPAATLRTSVVRLVVGPSVTSTDNITIKNCNILGSGVGQNSSSITASGTAADNTMGIYGGGTATGATSAPAALAGVNTSATGTMSNLVIDNNTITSCARGISVNAPTGSINSITVTNNILGTAGSTAGAPPYFGIPTTIYAVAVTIQGAVNGNISGNTVNNVMSCNPGPIRGMEIQGNTISNLQFQNNIINGVVANGTGCTGNEGLYIGGNMTTCNITGNTIMNVISLSSTANITALNLNNAASTTTTVVSGNKVSRVNNYTASAVPANGINLNGPNNVVLTNNMIWDITGRAASTPPQTTNEHMGIKVTTGTGHRIANNTVHMFGPQLSGTAAHGNTCLMVVSSASTGMDIRNNIFSMQMSGWPAGSVNSCVQFPTGLTTAFNATLNNNAYYAAAGNVLAQMTSGTTSYTTGNFVLGATTPATNWRSYSTLFSAAGTNDNASLAFTGAAPFVGANTDLHINNASATPLESGGASITGVTTDIDGQVRPGPAGSVNGGANMPDIGADEFDGIPQDVVPPTITYTTLASACTTGDRTLNATVTDNTGVPTTGADVPRIYYRKGAGSWFSSAGVLASGTNVNGVWTFTISATDMGGLAATDMVSYYIVAQDATPNVGATPGGGLVATGVNAVTTAPTAPNTYFIQPVSGTFEVGAGKPYATITAAVNAYNTNTCLTGDIVYQLTDVAYPSESYPINIANNPLAGPGVTLTIKPAAGVAVAITSTSAAQSVIKLTDARYVTIDGLNTGGAKFTITNGNTGNTTGNIWLCSNAGGVKNIALRNLTIIGGNNGTAGADEMGIFASNTSSSRTNGADNDDVTISGNSFEKCGYAIWGAGTSTNSAGGNDNWVITNNIVGPAVSSTTNNLGVNAMFFRNMLNLQITNNTIQNIGANTMTFGTAGIYLEAGINRAVVADNTITNHGCFGANTAMSINIGGGVINSRISGNKITTTFSASGTAAGIRAIDLNAGASCNDTIVNNMISEVYSNSSATNTSWPVGILVQGTTSGAKIWHNSIHLFGDRGGLANALAGSACIMVTTSGNNIDLRNNVLVNTYNNTGIATEKSYALYSTSASSVYSAIDNNDYFVSATNFPGIIGGVDRALIADMQTGFGGNTASISVNPNFVSNTDLHIAGGGPSGLESGAAVTGTGTDIDGNMRPGPAGSANGGGLIPDIGADEFDGTPVDVILPIVNYTALTSTCSAGDRVITATISDNIGVVTTGANMPRLYMKKNTGSYFSVPGTIISGNGMSGTWSFSVTASAFTPALTGGDQVSYFVVAQDAAGNLGGSPGVGITGTDVNAATPPTTPNVYNIFPASGTFNVGSGGTYPTITAAINAYNTNTCLTGHITYNLTDATYPTESFPINIANNTLAGPSVTLTIKPATGVGVTVTGGASTQSMFRFSDARYVTMDGVNAGGSSLTLVNANTGSNTCNIWLASSGAGNKFITLKNMNITGGANIPTATPYANEWGILCGNTTIGGNNGNDNDNITITGNTFLRCGYAMLVCGGAAVSAGGNDNWVVTNNIIGPATVDPLLGMGVNGVFFRNMVNFELSGNTLRNTGNTVNGNSFAPAGFYLEGGIDRAMVRNNTIDGFFTSKTGTSQILYLGGGVINSIISGNTFRNIGSNVSWTPRVININTGNANSNDTIVNNVITDVWCSAGTSMTTNWPVGIYIEGTAGGLKIWHNSINLYGPHAGQAGVTGSACIAIPATGGNLDIRNNILVNTYDNSSSTTDKNFAIYSSVALTNFSNIDHNDYWVSGAANVLGFLGSDRSNIAAMQAGFGGNIHSVNVNPNFTSATDLHIPAGTVSQLESGGASVGINTDYDGQVRPGGGGTTNGGGLLADIGADEFDGVIQDVVPPSTTYTNLLGACGAGDRTFTALITDASGVATGTMAPRVYYKRQLDGIPAWRSNAGVNLGGGLWSFTILASDMPGLATTNVVQYYVIAQDNAGALTSVPAAGLVATNVNTVGTHPTTPNTYTILNSLNGDVFVGAGQTYTTLGSAIAAYNSACLGGHVTFILKDANYNTGTGESFPLIINNSAFADADHTLTIKPDAGVSATITSSSGSAAVFKLLNTRYVTIDGVNTSGSSLSIVNGNTGANSCDIWLASNATSGQGNRNVALKNLTITGGTNNPTSAAGWGIIACGDGTPGNNSNGGDNDNITISGNTFLKCGYAILASGNNMSSTGGNDNWVVTNNIVGPAVSDINVNMGVNAMFFRYMVNLEVSNNLIRNVGTSLNTFGTAGVYMEGGINRAMIRNNTMTNITSTGNGSSFGIYMGATGGVINSIISGNTIKGMYNTNTATGTTMRGIYVHTGNAASNDTIVNNMISDLVTPTTTTAGNGPIGIGIETNSTATGGVSVWYNTVNLYGPHTGSTAAGALTTCLYVATTGSNLDIRNNIFSNTYDNTSQANEKSYAVYSTAGIGQYSNLNFNNYYALGSLAFFSGDRANLAAVQSFGGNAASFSARPVFVDDNDLHLAQVNANLPMVAGTPVAITTDFDGTTRNAITPFVGAHEAPKCSGALTAGTAVPVAPSLCASGVTTINNTTSTPGIGVKLQWQSSPDSVLFTDISGATSSTYVIPANITATTFYRMKANCVFSGNADSATAKVVVYPLPAEITGNDVCQSYTSALTSADAGGIWESDNAAATIGAASGIVTGNTVGTATISYTLPSTGCTRTRVLSINPLPATITGSTNVCVNASVTLDNADDGGTWSSGAANATVNGTTGEVTGVSAGFANISYTLPTGCFRFVAVSVDPLPALTVTPAVPAVVCLGGSGSFSASSAISNYTMLEQNFNTTLGDWTVTTPAGSPAAAWQIVPVGYDGTTVGDGTPMLQSAPIMSGPVHTIITSPSFATSNLESATLTFNQYLFSDPVDQKVAVEYSVDGGSNWLELVSFAPGVTGGDVWNATTALTTVPLPAPALNKPSVMLRWNYDAYVHWFIDNVAVKGAMPASTISWATTGTADGLSCTACSSATMTPTVAGSNIYNAIATSSLGCNAIVPVLVSVNPLPQDIGGATLEVCKGLSITLTNGDAGGTWSSHDAAIATIDGTSGVLTGHAEGTTTITYVLPTGCETTTVITVNPLPVAIAGTPIVCQGLSATLTNSDADGTWSSSDESVVAIGSASGIMTGGDAGNATVTYTLPTGCISTIVATVNPLPDMIGGALEVCEGLTTTLTNGSGPGTWTSVSTAVATIDGTTGTVTGHTAGNSDIIFTITATGCTRTAELTVNPLPAVIGGTLEVCKDLTTTLNSSPAGGAWESGDVLVATIDADGIVTGVDAGNAEITYTAPLTGCIRTAQVTVNPLPDMIGGTLEVCEGLTTTLTNASGPGTWLSGTTGIATIDGSTGVATGVMAGSSDITYTITSTGCQRVAELTVNPLPAAITGTMEVCHGLSTTLSSSPAGESWISGTTAVATVDAAGEVTGVMPGTATITYKIVATGCQRTADVTVNALPAAIGGPLAVCDGLTTTLTNATADGTWSSSDEAVATIGSTSGIASAMSVGNSTITYRLNATGCITTSELTVNPLPAAITGTSEVCDAASVTLSNSDGGGAWSSGATGIATVGTGGVVTGAGAGTAIITYTLPTTCIATHIMTVHALPTAYNVTGGGAYCADGAGVPVGVSNSEASTTYTLYNGATPAGVATGGSGSISFGLITAAGVYTVQAINSYTCLNGMTGSVTVNILPMLTPSVTIAAAPGDTVCAGTATTFTASPVNGGTTPSYVWKVNGTTVATGASASHTYVPANGDVITTTLTSSEACASPTTASGSKTMVVMTNETPVVTIAVGPNDTLCQGSLAVFAATSTWGGDGPVYTWFKNGTTTGITGATLTYAPVHGDVVFARLNSNYRCPVVNNVSSNSITMHIDSSYVPVITLSVNPGTTVAAGKTVTFTATVTQAGTSPAYRWLRNSTTIVGATSSTYVTNTIANGDSITCIVNGTGGCSYYSFNSVKMKVTTGVEDVAAAIADIRLVPNPSGGSFTITGSTGMAADEAVVLQVTDVLGRVVHTEKSTARNGIINVPVQLSNMLANGMYMADLHVGTGHKALHFVLTR